MKTIIQPIDFDAALTRYRGAYAKIWLFNVSHKRLALRLALPNVNEVIYIVAISCEHITGPFFWENASISIAQKIDNHTAALLTIITDKNAGFELISSGGISMAQGRELELDTSFDIFLGNE